MNGKSTRTRTVIIKLDKKGNLSYVPCSIELDEGDFIEWQCVRELPFAIHIGWHSPLPKGRYRSLKGESIKDVVPEGALPGRYKYYVSVCEDNHIWTDDPEFVVRRRGG